MNADERGMGPRALISLHFPAQDTAVRDALLRVDATLRS